MNTPDFQQRIREEHADLRKRLDALESLARQVTAADPSVAGLLRRETESLLVWLGVHIDYEDRILVPMVRSTAPGAEDRAEEMLRHHREQRRELRETLLGMQGAEDDPVALARQVMGIITEVRADMEYEESEYLA